MIIRKAVQQDIRCVATLYQEIHSAEEAGKMTIGWDRNIYPTEETAIQALSRDDLFVMLDDENAIAGAAIINQLQAEGYEKGNWRYPAEDRDIMVLHTLVISPSVNNRGYGKAFERFYEEYALKNGCHHLRIDTNAKNIRARSFYRTLGYAEADIVKTSFNGLQDIELVLLEKRLS